MEANADLTIENFEAAKAYWLNLLSAEIDDIRLPYDFQKTTDFARGNETLSISPEVFDGLSRVSKGNDMLLYIFLLAVLKVLIYKYINHRDIIVAAPILSLSKSESYPYNDFVVFRNFLTDSIPFKDLLKRLKRSVIEGYKHQHYSMTKVVEFLGLNRPEISLTRVVLVLESIHLEESMTDIIASPQNDMTFRFRKTSDELQGHIEYHSKIFCPDTIKRFAGHYQVVLEQVLNDLNIDLGQIDLLPEKGKKLLLEEFNRTRVEYPADRTITDLFERQVAERPENTAVVFMDECVTYRHLDQQANRLANYLAQERQLRHNEPVMILMSNSPALVISIIGILKAGGIYVPMNPGLPRKRLKYIFNDTAARIVVSEKRFINTLNVLLWECDSLNCFLCMDSRNVYDEDEEEKNVSMDKDLWDYIGATADDDITGGGWLTSYTGEPFSREEMVEYGNNVLKKLEPIINKRTRVLEIGCGTGITMYKIAPEVGYYHGTDLSDTIIRKNKEKVEVENLRNIKLSCLPAIEIKGIDEKNFDLIIFNSVVQSFHGHNYLRKVIRESLHLMGQSGYLFIGDVMDQDLKGNLIREMIEFKRLHAQKNYKTKTDFSSELFLSREFFNDLMIEFPEIVDVEFSKKLCSIPNELTKFRFDVLMTVEKGRSLTDAQTGRRKFLHDLSTLEKYNGEKSLLQVSPENGAYIIYTSGTTGKPKGVSITHSNLVNFVSWRIGYYRFDSRDVILQLIVPSFDVFGANLFPGILTGSRVVLVGNEEVNDYDYLKNVIEAEAVTTFSVVPSVFRLLVENSSVRMFRTVRLVVLGGETAARELIELTNKMGPNIALVNEYGPTENTVTTTACWGIDPAHTGIIGKPIANNFLYVLDRNKKLLPVGIAGELFISGEGLSGGYLNNPELTGESFIANPFREGMLYGTGDRVRWLQDGNLEFIGRIDEQVKVRGNRIEPAEVENVLRMHEEIEDAAVVTRETEDGENNLVAYFVSTGALDAAELREFLSKSLPAYMIPTYFIPIARIPLAVNGKVDKRSLPVSSGKEVNHHERPTGEIEEALVEIWADVLKIEKNSISLHSDFFQLGGHSLRAAVMLTNIHKRLNIKIPLSEVFRNSNFRDLTTFIKEQKTDKYSSLQPIEKKEYYIQSPAQKRMFVLDHLEAIGTCYNLPWIVKVDGKLDPVKCEKALELLVDRHDAFRTSFRLLGEKPVQRISDKVEFKLRKIEADPDISADELRFLIMAFVKRFDLSKAPLLRVGHIKKSEGEHFLFFDMHHIISDGSSMTLMIEDLIRLYFDEDLPPLRIQYKDFSHWQNGLIESGKIKVQENYWLKQFAGSIPRLNLPTDYPGKSTMSFEGDLYRFSLQPQETRAFKKMCVANDVTVHINLLAALNVLMNKYTGQKDIIVGSGTAGRDHADLHDIVGMFINVWGIRNYVKEDIFYVDFLKETRKKCLEALENQDYPFEDLVEKLNVDRSYSRNPIFNIFLGVENFEQARIDGGYPEEIKFSRYNIENTFKTSIFDIVLYVDEHDDKIHFAFEYSTQLYKRKSIEVMAKHFIEILNQIVENSHKRIRDFTISSDLVFVKPESSQEFDGDFNF